MGRGPGLLAPQFLGLVTGDAPASRDRSRAVHGDARDDNPSAQAMPIGVGPPARARGRRIAQDVDAELSLAACAR
jgi:hypothetical protein